MAGGGEGKRGRRVQLPEPRRGWLRALGSPRWPRRTGRERGPRRRFGKLNPALLPPRGPLSALQLLRRGWASVRPARGALGWVRGGELGAFGEPAERAGGGRDPAGARGPAGFSWLFVRKPNVKLAVPNRPITSGWYCFSFFTFREMHEPGGEGVSQRDCKNAYLEHR